MHEIKQIGQGSYGVVYSGEFRGNRVAIKKIKPTTRDHDLVLNEFEKEVAMLDKFRSDHLIHFYGASFFPENICMVTELAEFGSLQTLISEGDKMKPRLKMRVKMLLDCVRGIHYLHSNGILHRDIKPDNFLVISLDESDGINCKMTDFGSSRNINLLMTNMTFTKGIGTPAFMAPEILNRKYYKMPADIYSFAVTMLEVMIWGDAFPPSEFKFPWMIADFISSGNRPQSIEKVDNLRMKMTIVRSWSQDPHHRLSIEEIMDQMVSLINEI